MNVVTCLEIDEFDVAKLTRELSFGDASKISIVESPNDCIEIIVDGRRGDRDGEIPSVQVLILPLTHKGVHFDEASRAYFEERLGQPAKTYFIFNGLGCSRIREELVFRCIAQVLSMYKKSLYYEDGDTGVP